MAAGTKPRNWNGKARASSAHPGGKNQSGKKEPEKTVINPIKAHSKWSVVRNQNASRATRYPRANEMDRASMMATTNASAFDSEDGAAKPKSRVATSNVGRTANTS